MSTTHLDSQSANPAVELIRQCFEAYGRGDIPSFIAAVAEDCVWSGSMAPGVPYAGEFHGPAGAAKFFDAIGAHVEVQVFEMSRYVGDGEWVIAMGHWAGVVRKTGRRYESRLALAFQVRHGKIVRFTGYEDTGLITAALRG